MGELGSFVLCKHGPWYQDPKKPLWGRGTSPLFCLLRASPQTPVEAASRPTDARFSRFFAHTSTSICRQIFAHNMPPTALTAVPAVLATLLAPPINSGAVSCLFSISIGLKKKKAPPVVRVATKS